MVDVPGRGEMFVREARGPATAGPTVVLLHGWLFSADLTWFACYQPLADLARVVACDHRGHGRGPRPAEPFRLADAADDVAALLRHLGTGPAIVTGYSMGGAIAQLVWRRHPDVVGGLVLCASSASFRASARDRCLWRIMGLFQLLLRLIPRHWAEAAIAAQARGALPMPISRMISEHSPQQVRDLLPWMVAELSRGSAEDLAEAGRELGRHDARPWLGQVDVPTAVVVTSEDRLVPARNQRDLAARIPGAFVLEVALDHDGVIAQPELFVPVLAQAVQQVASRVASAHPTPA
ncbi:MAG TPA: alpha/beta hydrolase [Egibacteraceae bacterium]|nr:alpha/beta hydrolase [Egibacteraceae bacterium]